MAVLALAVAAASGCSNAPGVSNGSVSACFRAIPVGRAALHEKSARLIGVHRIPADRVRAHLPAVVEKKLAAEDDTVVCAMAFSGKFAAGQVKLAPPNETGHYALVVVSSRKLDLLGAFVLSDLPRTFGGRTV